jgi:hypothetical protein
MEFERLA